MSTSTSTRPRSPASGTELLRPHIRVVDLASRGDDHDLIDNGFADKAWWTEVAGDVLIVATADSQLVSVLAGVSWTIVGAGYARAATSVQAASMAPRQNPGTASARSCVRRSSTISRASAR